MNFDILFNESDLPWVLKQAKTLSKNECFEIFEYMQRYKPINIIEFGVQYGCSTSVFLEIAKWMNHKIVLNSWDIRDSVKCADKKEFKLHIEDITGREEVILDYAPDLVFLDAHPYVLTKNIVQICLREKIDFMCHDVSVDIYNRAKQRSNNFTNHSPLTMAEWELYVLCELINEDLVSKNFFENENLTVRCIRDKYGLAIIQHKR
jgi:hypothetical protein